MRLIGQLQQKLASLGARKKLASIMRRPTLASAGLFLLALLFGFWWAFPQQQLLLRVQQEFSRQSGLRLTAQSAEIGFPLRLRFTDCRLEPLPNNTPLRFEEVRLSPYWSGLLTGKPGVAVEVDFWGGEMEGVLARDGGLNIEVSGLDLARLEGLPGSYRLAGRLSGAAEGRLLPTNQLAWEVSLERLGLSGLQAFGIADDLSLGSLRARGELKGRNLQLAELQLGGGVLEAKGEGTLLIGPSPARSRINASLEVAPQQGLPSMFKDLLSLSGQQPDAQGRYRFRLSGRLDAPNIK